MGLDEKMEHYYSENPTSEVTEAEVRVSLFGNTLNIITVSGVFSHGAIDRATTLLIEKCEFPKEGLVLDLGCGYGIVGCAIAKSRPDLHVLMTDVNSRALEYAKRNAIRNHLKNCLVRKSDGFSAISEKFDAILLNPPISAGRELCMRLISDSQNHLKSHGSLQVVARHNKGGRFYSEYMDETFGNCETVVKSGGFRVYISWLKAE